MKSNLYLKIVLSLISLGIYTFLVLNSKDFASLIYLFSLFLGISVILSLKNIFSKPVLLIVSWMGSCFLIWWGMRMLHGDWPFIGILLFVGLCIIFSYYLKDLALHREKKLKMFSNCLIILIFLISIFYFELSTGCISTSIAEKGVTDFAISKCKFFGLYSPSGHAPFWTPFLHLLFILFTWGPLGIFGLFQAGRWIKQNK